MAGHGPFRLLPPGSRVPGSRRLPGLATGGRYHSCIRKELTTVKKIFLLLIVVAVGLLIAKQFTSSEH